MFKNKDNTTFSNQPYIQSRNGQTIAVNQALLELIDYSEDDILFKPAEEIFRISLRITSCASLLTSPESGTGMECYIFTRNLEVREVGILIIKDHDTNVITYIFSEKPDSRLEHKLRLAEKLLLDNHMGIGIYSSPDLVLLKANQTYLNILDEPFNKRENTLGLRINDFIPWWEASKAKERFENTTRAGDTYYAKEIKGITGHWKNTYCDNTIVPISENGAVKYVISIIEDVTEKVLSRKTNEEQARVIEQQKQQLEAIINSMSDGLFILDNNNNFTFLNQAGKDFFYQPETVKKSGDSFKHTSYFDLEGKALSIDKMVGTRVLRGETVKQFRLKVVRPDKTAYFSLSGNPVYDSIGNIDAAVICCRDITEQVEKEEEILHKNKQLQAIFDNMSDGLFISDKDGNYSIFNSVARNMLHQPDTLKAVGDTYSTTRYLDEEGNEIPLYNMPTPRALKGEKVSNQRILMKLPDKEIAVSANSTPVYDISGKLKMTITCLHDITDSYHAQKVIKQQKDQLEAIIENMSDALTIIDKDGNFIKSNKALVEYMKNTTIGKTVDSRGDSIKKGLTYYDESGNEMDVNNIPSSRVLRGEKVDKQKVIIRQNNRPVYFEMSGTPVFDSKGDFEYGIITSRDITAREEYYKLLEAQQQTILQAEIEKRQTLEKAIEMKDEFLSIISHEFKTPLTVINSAIQAIELLCRDELSEKLKGFISKIKQNSFRQLRLVNNLLDITRINAGAIKIHKRNLDIVFLTKAITASVSLYASQKSIDLTFKSVLGSKIIGIDDEKYERILLNLLSNAIKFTPEGKSIMVKMHTKGSYVSIEVKDEGLGIPEDKLQLIFERFGQVDSSLSRQAEGTGIGLSLVRLLVEALDGMISVKSKAGKGSTFTVLLPAAKVEKEQEDTLQDLTDNRLIQSVAIEFSDIYLG